jgi:hypothetical protein
VHRYGLGCREGDRQLGMAIVCVKVLGMRLDAHPDTAKPDACENGRGSLVW